VWGWRNRVVTSRWWVDVDGVVVDVVAVDVVVVFVDDDVVVVVVAVVVVVVVVWGSTVVYVVGGGLSATAKGLWLCRGQIVSEPIASLRPRTKLVLQILIHLYASCV